MTLLPIKAPLHLKLSNSKWIILLFIVYTVTSTDQSQRRDVKSAVARISLPRLKHPLNQ